jgi:chemotaxis protein MotB
MRPNPRFIAVALGVAVSLGAAPGCGADEENARLARALEDEKAAHTKDVDARAAAEKEAATLRGTVKDLETKISDTDTHAGESEKALGDLRKEMDDLRATLGHSTAELEAARAKAAELAKKSAEFRDLAAALKGEIGSGKVELLDDRVRLKDKVLFDSGSAALNPDGEKALGTIAKVFKRFGRRRIFEITGHTDSVGPPEDNWRLSTERALTVVLYLTKLGVSPSLMSAAGFGEHHPVCPKNDTEACRASNRRIEIILLPNIDLSPGPPPKAPPPAAAKPATAAPKAPPKGPATAAKGKKPGAK